MKYPLIRIIYKLEIVIELIGSIIIEKKVYM